MRNFLFASVVLLCACSDATNLDQHDSSIVDSVAVMKDTTLPRPQASVLDTLKVEANNQIIRPSDEDIAELIRQLIPLGWDVIDTMTGDLNRDQYIDLLIILRDPAEDSLGDVPRPLLVCTGDPENIFTVVARNENVVLCKDCGGVFGDPYDGLAIKNGYFSVEHYGGSSWRWTNISTFKYNESQKTWLLHRDAGVSYNVFDPDGTEEENVRNQEHYGKMKFTEYNSGN